jgi:hypothetical protein
MKTKAEIQKLLKDNNIDLGVKYLSKKDITLCTYDNSVSFLDLKKLSILFGTEEITIAGRGGDGSDDGWHSSWTATEIEIVNHTI